MAVQAFAEIAKKVVEKSLEIAKKGLETTIEKVKDGANIGDALKEGWKEIKTSSLDALKEVISPEKVEVLEESSTKITELQDQVELNPDSVLENPQDFVKELSEVENQVTDIVKEINDTNFKDLNVSEVLVEALNKVLDMVKQIQEIKDVLTEKLGINIDDILKEILNSGGANEIPSEEGSLEGGE